MAILINTSFFAEESYAPQLVEWIRTVYIAKMEAFGAFRGILLSKVMTETQPGVTTFALQALCDDTATANRWIDTESKAIIQRMVAKAGGRVQLFTTLMETIAL